MNKNKKRLAVALFCIIYLVSAIPVFAADKLEACNPKKVDQCCKNINTAVQSLEILKFKLLKLEAELKAGKKINNELADKILNKTSEMEDFFTNTEGGISDF